MKASQELGRRKPASLSTQTCNEPTRAAAMRANGSQATMEPAANMGISSQESTEPVSRPAMMAKTVRTPAVAAPAMPARSAESRNAAVVSEPLVRPKVAVTTKTAAGRPPSPKVHQAKSGRKASLRARARDETG